MSNLEYKTVHALNRRIIENFMDIVILKHIWRNQSTSGYDVIKFLHRKFHILESPGKIYSILYLLERQSLIEGSMTQRKRVYRLTSKGEGLLRNVLLTRKHVNAILFSIFSEF